MSFILTRSPQSKIIQQCTNGIDNLLIRFSLTYGRVSLVRQWTMEKREGYVIQTLLKADFNLAFVSLKSKLTNLA